MTTRIVLASFILLACAACTVVTGPGPAAPDPGPVEPGPTVPSPAPPDPSPAPVVPSPGPVEPAPQPTPAVDDWKKCHEAEDCVPVGCTCSCSGCGGFSSEDIVSKDFEDAWYEKKGCEPAHVCPQVCCPPMTVVCQDGRCGVVAGEKMNVH